MASNKDWVATLLFNNPSSFDELVAHGITPDNVNIQSEDFYKKNEEVQKAFTKDGKFDEATFDNFYTSAVSTYNDFANEDWEKKLIDNLAKDPFDWTQPLKTEVKNVSATITPQMYNPDRRSMGITGIDVFGDPTFSIREIAQDNYVRDENGNKLDWTPNQHSGIYKSILDPTIAIAIYDEDGYDEINGQKVFHKKGDYKTDENGNFYYEVLGDKESYNRDVLRYTDTLTIDGTTLNKFDFFDSDGLEKNITGTLVKTAVTLTPYLIPGVRNVMGVLGIVSGLTSIMPTLGKAINGMFGGDNSKSFGKKMTAAENWFQKFAPTQSDKGQRDGFWSLESIADILVSSASQLYSQKTLGELTYGIQKAVGAGNKNLARELSLGFMAITSSDQVYSDFKEAGASDQAAGIGMLASIGTLYGLMHADYFREWLFKGGVLDESEAPGIVKNLRKELTDPYYAKLLGKDTLSKEEAKALYNASSSKLKNLWQKFLASPVSGKAQSLATKAAKKTKIIAKDVIGKAFNEGVEETMEETTADAVKCLFLGAEALGIPVEERKEKKLDFGYTPQNIITRYGQAFIGGFLGGAVFEGLNRYEHIFGPKVVELASLDAKEQTLYMIASGRANELYDRLDVLYNKGYLGNKNLSATKTRPNSEGNTVFEKGDDKDNQARYNYAVIKNYIRYMENIINDFGLYIKYGRLFSSDDFEKIASGELTLTENEIFKKNREAEELLFQESKAKSQDEFFAADKGMHNAYLATIKELKLHTTYADDIVSLANDIVDNRAAIDKIVNESTNASTREEREIAAENVEKNKNLEYLKQKQKELDARRDQIMLGKNDDEYADQVLFAVSPEMNEPWIKGIKNADGSYETPYWQQSPETFAQTIYGKKFNELSKYEQDAIKKEMNTSKLDDIQLKRRAAALHYKMMELLSPRLKELETKTKDLKSNAYYNHGIIGRDSKEFSQYIKDQAEFIKLIHDLKDLQKNFETNYNQKEQELLKDPRYEILNLLGLDAARENARLRDELLISDNPAGYDEVKDFDIELQTIVKADSDLTAITNEIKVTQDSLNNLSKNITEFNKRFSLNRDAVSESISDTGLTEFLDKIIGLDDQISNFDDLIVNLQDGLDDYEHWTDFSEINASVKAALGDGFEINAEEVNNKNVIKEAISRRKKFLSDKFDLIENYYKTLRDKKMVSDNDSILNTVLFNLVQPHIKTANVFDSEYANMLEETGIKDTPQKRESLYSLLQKLSSGQFTMEDFKNIKENFESNAEFKDALKTLLNIDFDIESKLKTISELKTEVIPMDVVDLIRDFELNVGDDVISVIKLLKEQENVLIGFNDVTKYIINNPAIDAALRKIPDVVKMMETLISPLTNGYSSLLNIYRKKAEKDDLIVGLNENTVNFLRSDMNYLAAKANALISISDTNKAQQARFHFESEKNFKSNIIKSLFSEVTSGKSSIASKLKDKLPEIDLIDIWKNIIADQDFSEITNENIAKYTKAFFDFAEQVGEKLRKIDKEKLNSIIVDLIDENAYKLNSGKFTDDLEYVPTNLESVYFLASCAATNLKEDYLSLKELHKTDDNIIPLFNQDWVILTCGAYFEDPDIFNAILGKIKNDITSKGSSADNYLRNKAVIENTIFVQGGPGTGKTSGVDVFVQKLLKKKHSDLDVVVIAPHKTQLDNLQNKTGIKPEKAYLLDDFINKNCATKPKPKSGEDTYHTLLYNDVEIKLTKPIKPIFDKTSKNKLIIVDEVTFASEGDMQILSAIAKAENAIIICSGDKKQNGKIVFNDGKFAISGVEDCIIAATQELTSSIRCDNAAMQTNIAAVENLVNIGYNIFQNEPELPYDEISKKIGYVSINFDYYENSGSEFVGGKVVSDTKHYVDEFTKLAKDGETVAIITDNPNNYSDYSGKYSNLTFIDANKVQGGEFDYVIIDKSFNKDGATLYDKLKDLNTMVSRAKKGFVIKSDNSLAELNIKTAQRDKSVATVPTAITASKDKIIEWRNMVDALIKSSKSETPTSTSGTESSSGSSGGETKSGSGGGSNGEGPSGGSSGGGSKSGLGGGSSKPIGVSEFDDGIPEVSLDTGILDDTSIKDDTKKEQEKVKIDNKKRQQQLVKDSVVKPGDTLYDRKEFIDDMYDPKSETWLQDKKSSMNMIDDMTGSEEYDKIDRYRTFVRLFSSGIIANMAFEERHVDKLVRYTSLDRNIAESVCAQWNNVADDERKFWAVPVNDSKTPKSIIYFPVIINDQQKLIPISEINQRVEGIITVPRGKQLFKLVKAIEFLKGNKNSSGEFLISSFNYGTTYSGTKVFAPEKEAPDIGTLDESSVYSTYKQRVFRKKSIGRSYTVWSPIDILTDEDLESVFYYRKSKTGTNLAYTSTEIDQMPTFTIEEVKYYKALEELNTKFDKKEIDWETYSNELKKLNDETSEYAKQKIENAKHGTNSFLELSPLRTISPKAPVTLVGTKRVASLADLYNIVCIERFVLGSIEYKDLSDTQRSKFAGNSKDAAEMYLRQFIGGFNLNKTGSADEAEQRKIQAENFQKLRGIYRLLPDGSAKYLLNAFYLTFNDDSFDPDKKMRYIFETNVLRLIQTKTIAQTGTQAGIRSGLKVTMSNGRGKENKKTYLVLYDAAESKYKIYGQAINSNLFYKEKPIASITGVGYEKGKTLTTRLSDIVQAINNSLDNGGVKVEFNESNIKSSKILFELTTEHTIQKGSDITETRYYVPSDYDHIYNMLRGIPIESFSDFENTFRKNSYFKHGITLNDVGQFIPDSEKPKTCWKNIDASLETTENRVSDTVEMLPPIYEFNTIDTIVEKGDLNSLYKKVTTSPTIVDPKVERLNNYLDFQKNLVTLLNRTLGYDVESRLVFNEIIKDAYLEGDEQAAAAINEMLKTAGIPIKISDDLTMAEKTQNGINDLHPAILKQVEKFGLPIKDITSIKVNKNKSGIVESFEVYINSDKYMFNVNNGEVRPIKIIDIINNIQKMDTTLIEPWTISEIVDIIKNINFQNYAQQLDVLYAAIEDKVTNEDAASILFNIADDLSDAFSSNDFKKICN